MEYKNRYGDVFTFTQLENGNIQWSGNFEYHRVGYNDDNETTMVDPSGGPYISLNSDMKLFGLKGIVKEFKSNEDGYEILVQEEI
jgi:hypothetical protein